MSGESLQGGSSLATGKSLLRHAFWFFGAVLVVAFLVLAVIGEVGHLPKIDWSFDFWWLVPAFVALVIFPHPRRDVAAHPASPSRRHPGAQRLGDLGRLAAGALRAHAGNARRHARGHG